MKKTLKTLAIFLFVILVKELPLLSLMNASATTLNGRIIFFSLIALGIIVYVTKRFGYFDGIDLKTFFTKKNIGTVILSYFAYIILSIISLKIIESLSMPVEDPANQIILEDIASIIKPSGLFVLVVIFAPITEEIIFRSMIQNKLFKNKLIGVLLSSVLFALMHASDSLITYIPYFLMGLVFSFSYYYTKRIETPIFVHILNNFIAFMLMIQ